MRAATAPFVRSSAMRGIAWLRLVEDLARSFDLVVRYEQLHALRAAASEERA